MPHFDEQIRGDREAVRIQEAMQAMLARAQQKKLTETQPQLKGDLRQFAACCFMALAGLAFAVLIMMVARYH
jgi:hypothetical protein